MKVLFFANKMPDLCGAFLHDIDLAIELQNRGHQVVFLTIQIPKEGYNGGSYRGFRFLHYTAASGFLDTSNVWICPHAPVLPAVRKLNEKGYGRPIIATCHYDGNYNTLRMNVGTKWVEMLFFINSIMEPNYRKNIVPWPSNITRTDVVRPILHREKIVIPDTFHGDAITLINANQNKGVHVFLEIAKRMPERRFLGVLPYYGEMRVPPAPSNVEWIPFQDDIRTILRRTRILLVPSYYESFGRVAMEAMINGIPVLYSKPNPNSVYPGGSTEGVASWIGDAAIPVDREVYDEWATRIRELDDEETWTEWSEKAKTHIEGMNVFQEASRIAGLVESFSRDNPVIIKTPEQQRAAQAQTSGRQEAPRLTNNPQRQVGFGFSNGQLKILR
jgi:glycosyltransferase involved in cell wall biosynthesis